MRRVKQQLSHEACEEILARGTSGVLAVLGDDNYPYAVPLSYAYDAGKIYFHSALTGHKLDAIALEPKVSFCVIDRDEIHPEKYTTYFTSVIVFGRIRTILDPTEKERTAQLFAQRFCPNDQDGVDQEIATLRERFCMLELTIEHMTGKQAKELCGRRNKEQAE